MEENSTLPHKIQDSVSPKIIISFLWLLSLGFASYFGYIYGQTARPPEEKVTQNVLPAVADPTSTPVPTLMVTPKIINNNVCSKSGFAPKWEYLTAYTVKEGDSLQSIVEEELKDKSRINEVMEINGARQLVLGSTLYLPPKSVTKSTGNIQQVSGRLIEKSNASWHLSFNGQKDGQGILIPSFWFGELKDKDNYHVGDCLTILLDDGFKVFTISKQ